MQTREDELIARRRHLIECSLEVVDLFQHDLDTGEQESLRRDNAGRFDVDW